MVFPDELTVAVSNVSGLPVIYAAVFLSDELVVMWGFSGIKTWSTVIPGSQFSVAMQEKYKVGKTFF